MSTGWPHLVLETSRANRTNLFIKTTIMTDGSSDTTRPDFSVLNQTLAAKYGNSALQSLQNKFDYDAKVPVQDFLSKSFQEIITPTNPDYKERNQDLIEFTIPGNQQDFIADVHLCVDVQPWNLTTDAAFTEATATTARALPRPLFPYLLFNNITLMANNNRLDFNRANNNTYAFNRYLHMVLHSDLEDEPRLKKSDDFDIPPPGEDPDAAIRNDLVSDDNGTEYQKHRRGKMIALQTQGAVGSAGRHNYVVPIHIPILRASCLSVLGANYSFQLHKANIKQLFANSANAPAGNVECKIHDCKLLVKRLSVQTLMLTGILEAVKEKGAFTFNVVHTKTERHALNAGLHNWTESYAQGSSKPSMVWISFINDQALNGSVTHTPFKLQNLDPLRMKVSFDGSHYPFPNGYELPNVPTAMDKRLLYETMGRALWGCLPSETEKEKWWTQERYENYQHVLVFDITRANTAYLGGQVKDVTEAGMLSVDIQFGRVIPPHIVAMVTSLFSTAIYMSHTTLTPDMDAIGV